MKQLLIITAAIVLAVTVWILYSQDYITNTKQSNQNTTMDNEYTTTNSGLQYKVINQTEEGAQPSGPTARVEVHYEGRLTDGTIFDSSRQRGETITFGLNQVIAGWSEGVQLMTEGDTYEFYIPANLAYGAQGVPGVIPPNSDLVFEVELIQVID